MGQPSEACIKDHVCIIIGHRFILNVSMAPRRGGLGGYKLNKLIIAIAVSASLAATPSIAFKSSDVLENINSDVMQGYLHGVSQAYTMADAVNSVSGNARLFCTPDSVALDANIAEAALRTATRTLGGDTHPAAAILKGLEMMFPC